MIPRVRHGFERKRQATIQTQESLAKQEFKEQVDIHNIIRKYKATGQITHLNRTPAKYGYATGRDFAEAMNIVVTAQESFQAMPAELRARFNNDPGAFLDFVDDPDNADKLADLGLITTPAQPLPEASKEAPKADASAEAKKGSEDP